MIEAYKHINQKNMLHRDIKLDNTLLKDKKVKLADFGFGKQVKKSFISETFIGTPLYMAPEVLNK